MSTLQEKQTGTEWYLFLGSNLFKGKWSHIQQSGIEMGTQKHEEEALPDKMREKSFCQMQELMTLEFKAAWHGPEMKKVQ